MGTASLTIKSWDISFDLSKPLCAQSESQILKLGCVRTRASKEAVARKDEGSEKQWDCELLEGVQSTRGYMARSFPVHFREQRKRPKQTNKQTETQRSQTLRLPI